MARVLTAGDALHEVMVQNFWAAGEADRAWHDSIVIDVCPQLKNPLTTFLKLDEEDRSEALYDYIAAWYELPNTVEYDSLLPVNRGLELLKEVKILTRSLTDVVEKTPGRRSLTDMEQKPGPSKAETDSDKWTRPNRIVCEWGYGKLDISAYAVLQTMVSHGNDQGGRIFISQRKIADIHGWSTTEPVRRAQKRLEKVGALTKLTEGRHGKPTQWRLNKP